MTDLNPEVHPSLARRISVQVGAVALITSIIQLLVVVGIHYLDYDDLALDHVRRETEWLLAGVTLAPSGLSFELPRNMNHHSGGHGTGYAFRVLDSKGRIVAAEQSTVLDGVSPWQPSSGTAMPGLWFRKLDDTQRFYFAGGYRFHIGSTDVLIEIATRGDPARIYRWIVAYETLEDVWLPILPFTILIPLATLLAVRRNLNFLTSAAQEAERADPANPTKGLDFGGIPREAAPFALAINRLLERVSALVQSHHVFMASAAHELRTPLSAILLELEMIDHPRARLLEKDIAGMSEGVDRLLTLVRLQAAAPTDPVDIDIGAVVWDTIESLRAWITAHHHEVELRLEEAGSIRGDPIAIREAVRNLVENAVKHTPAGTPIRVTVGTECRIMVEDGGPGLPAENCDQLFQPFCKGATSTEGTGLGLTIVRRAVDLHRGSIEIGRSRLGGAMFKVRFA